MASSARYVPDHIYAYIVTDPNGRIPRSGITGQPRTACEFAQAFNRSSFCEENRKDMLQYQAEFIGNPARQSQYRLSAQMEHAKHTSKESPYIISIQMQAKALMKRRWEILRGDKLTVGLNVAYVNLNHSLAISRLLTGLTGCSLCNQSSWALFSTIWRTSRPHFTRVAVSYSCKPHK
jgi:hypothetical protein